MKNNIAQIIVPNLAPLDYLVPSQIEVELGDLVIVPFRSQRILGLVWKLNHQSEFPIEKLRSIEKKIDAQLPELYLKLIQWMSDYYLYSAGHILRMIIPTQIASYFIKEKTYKATIPYPTLKYIEPKFNPEQIEAINKINQLISNKNHNIILDGVTGSGKTEVYLSVINNASGQTLIMLPEIALTTQIIDRITKRFGSPPYIWHSNITEKQRRETFLKIIDGSAKIIIGARSALFLPFKNLSMIIVDEEHEQSYKQEEGVTYQARDMAIMRATLGNIPIILASASPSLESIHNIALGKLNLVTLTGRYNDNSMPKIHIIDMKKEKHKGYFIAPKLIEAVKNNLESKQQSLLFINRKGYSPVMICKACGHQKCCNSCSSSMVYHKSQKKLKCHQCGFVAAIPKTCSSCNAEETFIPCGPGVERLAEEVQELIPNARIIILTQESFQNQKQAEIILNSINNKEYDIIIGTQIIAKGHHFPSLTVVGVIDADSSMMGGDLRASERTYQLLQQVGGRAGREIENSQIFIQTFNPEHPLILALASYKRDQFIIEEMKTRQVMNMPPFGRLGAIILSSKQELKLIDFTKEFVKLAPISKQISVLGPAPALLYKIRGSFRYRILIKTKRNIDIQKFFNSWTDNLKIPSHIQIKIDIDPYYFL